MTEQKKKETLMEALEKAGYPRQEMFNHCSDLYVYATPLTKRVITRWCKENGYTMDFFTKIFKDQITGRPMYDVAFQYAPYWEEMARRNDVNNEIAATKFVAAIKEIAANEENLSRLGSYLSYHFDSWLRQYANTPDGIADELERFAKAVF